MIETNAITEEMIQSAEMEAVSEDLVQQLSTLSSKDLKQKVRQYNEEAGLSQGMSGYISVGSTKDEMIDALVAAELSNTVHDRPVAEAEGFTAEVVLSQIEMSPFNFRNPIDYEDSQLVKAIKASGGMLKAPIVRATDRTDSQGRAIYEVIGGNRSTEALKRVVAENGQSVDDYVLTVIVRNYSGPEIQQYMQESLEMIMDNESQRPASPQDRLRAYKHLIELGLTQTAISEKLGVSVAYISKTLKLALLPERIMDLVHFEFNKAAIARESVETLERFRVPYTLGEDGSVTVHGISLDNATTMVDMFPKPPTARSENYAALKARYDAEVRRISKFLESPQVIESACHNVRNEFRNQLKDMAIAAGILKVEAPAVIEQIASEPETVQENAVATQVQLVQEVEQQAVEAVEQTVEAVEPSGEDVQQDFFTYEDELEAANENDDFSTDTRSAFEAGQDLLHGELELSDDWIVLFSDALKIGDSKAYAAYKYLFALGVLQDVI